MPLTHDQLRLAKSRRSLADLELLLAFAEETIGTPPLRTADFDEEGNRIEAPAEEAELESAEEAELESAEEEAE